ncbi:MAG: alpha/beta hydrolase fold domain-containing protein [Pyrinomonadaceae bacterium]
MKYPSAILLLFLSTAINIAAQQFRDDFAAGSLDSGWNTIREPERSRISISSRPGFLQLRGSTVTLDDTEVAPVFIGRKLSTNTFQADAKLEFDPTKENETAGVVLRRSERERFEFGIRKSANSRELFLQFVIGSVRSYPAVEKIRSGPIILRVRGFAKYYRFSYSLDGKTFIEVGGVETRLIDGETNPQKIDIGLFATGNGVESNSNADFDWFEYGPAATDPYADLVTTDPSLPKGYTIFSVAAAEKGIIQKYPFITRPNADVPPNVEAHNGLVYANYGSRAMKLDLFKPKGRGPFPAVIVVHGGAWITGNHKMENPLAIALARRGYVAVTVEHRLSNEKKYPAQIHDLKASVRWLRANAKRWNIDPARTGAVGASSGGHLVALLGATNEIPMFEGEGGNSKFSSRVQSVVDIDGTATFIDPGNIEKEIKGPWNTNTTLTGFTYAQNPAIWAEASPITHVNPKSAPTLFLNSSSNRPFQQREEMSAKLQALGIKSEIVVVPDTPHPFWLFRPWFDTTVENIDRFFRLTLTKTRR